MSVSNLDRQVFSEFISEYIELQNQGQVSPGNNFISEYQTAISNVGVKGIPQDVRESVKKSLKSNDYLSAMLALSAIKGLQTTGQTPANSDYEKEQILAKKKNASENVVQTIDRAKSVLNLILKAKQSDLPKTTQFIAQLNVGQQTTITQSENRIMNSLSELNTFQNDLILRFDAEMNNHLQRMQNERISHQKIQQQHQANLNQLKSDFAQQIQQNDQQIKAQALLIENQLRYDLQQTQQQNKTLQQNYLDITNQLSAQTLKAQKAVSDAQNLKSDLQNLKTDDSIVIAQFKGKITALQKQLDDRATELTQKSADILQANIDLTNAIQAKSDGDSEIIRLSNQIRQLQQDEALLSQDVKAKNINLQALQDDVTSLQNEIAKKSQDLKDSQQNYNNLVSKSKSDISNLESESARLKKQLLDRDNEITNINLKLQKTVSDLNSVNLKVNSLDKTSTSYQNDLQKEQAIAANLRSDVIKLQSDNQVLISERTKLQQDFANNQQLILQSNQDNQQLQQKEKILAKKISDLDNEIALLQATAVRIKTDTDNEKARYQKQISDLQKTNADLLIKEQQLTTAVAASTSQSSTDIVKYQQTIKDQARDLDKLNDALIDARKTLTQFQNKSANKATEINRLQAQVQTLQANEQKLTQDLMSERQKMHTLQQNHLLATQQQAILNDQLQATDEFYKLIFQIVDDNAAYSLLPTLQKTVQRLQNSSVISNNDINWIIGARSFKDLIPIKNRFDQGAFQKLRLQQANEYAENQKNLSILAKHEDSMKAIDREIRNIQQMIKDQNKLMSSNIFIQMSQRPLDTNDIDILERNVLELGKYVKFALAEEANEKKKVRGILSVLEGESRFYRQAIDDLQNEIALSKAKDRKVAEIKPQKQQEREVLLLQREMERQKNDPLNIASLRTIDKHQKKKIAEDFSYFSKVIAASYRIPSSLPKQIEYNEFLNFLEEIVPLLSERSLLQSNQRNHLMRYFYLFLFGQPQINSSRSSALFLTADDNPPSDDEVKKFKPYFASSQSQILNDRFRENQLKEESNDNNIFQKQKQKQKRDSYGRLLFLRNNIDDLRSGGNVSVILASPSSDDSRKRPRGGLTLPKKFKPFERKPQKFDMNDEDDFSEDDAGTVILSDSEREEDGLPFFNADDDGGDDDGGSSSSGSDRYYNQRRFIVWVLQNPGQQPPNNPPNIPPQNQNNQVNNDNNLRAFLTAFIEVYTKSKDIEIQNQILPIAKKMLALVIKDEDSNQRAIGANEFDLIYSKLI